MNVAKPSRPNDAKTIIIFVIGGLCCYEIAAVRRTLKHLKTLDHTVNFCSFDDVFVSIFNLKIFCRLFWVVRV